MMAIDWTTEKIAELSTDHVRNLCDNARNRQEANLVELCESELAKRSVSHSARKSRKAHSSLRTLEEQYSVRIAAIARELAAQFDLSPETARQNSQGVPGYRTHNLLQKNGQAKVGGEQRKGKCQLDRYVSYRVRDILLSLHIWLAPGEAEDLIRFQVFAPRELLQDGQPLSNLRPGFEGDAEMKLFAWGMEFQNIDEAGQCFAELVSKVASPIS